MLSRQLDAFILARTIFNSKISTRLFFIALCVIVATARTDVRQALADDNCGFHCRTMRQAERDYKREQIDLTRRAGQGGGSPAADPIEEAFASMFTSLIFSRWAANVARKSTSTLRVSNVPDCIIEFEKRPGRYSLRGHPLESQLDDPSWRWMVIYRAKSKEAAVAAGCLLGTEFPSSQVFAIRTGEFAVVAGTERTRQAQRILDRYKNGGDFPPEAHLLRGQELTERVWAAPNIMQNERGAFRR